MVEDYLTAPIPDIHKTLFSWVKNFTQGSWNFTLADLDNLRAVGLRDQDIVDWAQTASLQTWLVMSADGGGVTLDSEAAHGQAIGFEREAYHGAQAGLTAAETSAQPAVRSMPRNGVA